MAKRKKLDSAALAAAQDAAAKLQAKAQVIYTEGTECGPISGAEDAGLKYAEADDTINNVLRRIISDVPSLADPKLAVNDPAALKWRAGVLRGYCANIGPQWIVRSERGEYSVVKSAERPKTGTAELVDVPALVAMTPAEWSAMKKAAPQRHAQLVTVAEAAQAGTRGRFKTFKRNIATVKAGGVVKRPGRPKGAKTNDTFVRLAGAIKTLLGIAKAGRQDGSLTADQAGEMLVVAKALAAIKPADKVKPAPEAKPAA